MITKRTSLIRLLVCIAAFGIFYLLTWVQGDDFSDIFGTLVECTLFMFCAWTLFVWLRGRIGRHCYWVIPVLCALYYGVGLLIVDAIPGWSGLGAALIFLFTLVVLATAVVLFLIEMLIYWFYRKK